MSDTPRTPRLPAASRPYAGSRAIMSRHAAMTAEEKWAALREFLGSDRKPMDRLAGESTMTCMRACLGYAWALQDIQARMDNLDEPSP